MDYVVEHLLLSPFCLQQFLPVCESDRLAPLLRGIEALQGLCEKVHQHLPVLRHRI